MHSRDAKTEKNTLIYFYYIDTLMASQSVTK